MNTNVVVIAAVLLITSSGCLPSGDKPVLEKKWLSAQLGLSHMTKTSQRDSLSSSLVSVLDSLYPSAIVDSIFVDSLNTTRAFEFQLTSGCVGIAVVRYDAHMPAGMDCYNLFDVSLERQLRPSFSILLFNDTRGDYVLDGSTEELYVRERCGRLERFERGFRRQRSVPVH
jgi:hypothetical protein